MSFSKLPAVHKSTTVGYLNSEHQVWNWLDTMDLAGFIATPQWWAHLQQRQLLLNFIKPPSQLVC